MTVRDRRQVHFFDWVGPPEAEKRFAEFDAKNPEVWRLFERFTRELLSRGIQHGSADAVLHRIRWETAVAMNGGDGFKINNNWSPYYARKWARAFPEHKHFFRMRKLRTTVEDGSAAA